jgi:hypothetical protein
MIGLPASKYINTSYPLKSFSPYDLSTRLSRLTF